MERRADRRDPGATLRIVFIGLVVALVAACTATDRGGETDGRGNGASPPRSHESAPASVGAGLSRELRRAVTLRRLRAHVAAFQAIARRNGGNRAAGTRGYDESARYVYGKLRAAGYEVRFQEVPFGAYVEKVERARVVSPTSRDLRVDAIDYSPSTPKGGLTAELAVVPVEEDGSHGCESGDFENRSYKGTVALIKRGECSFALKAENASRAGAAAAIVYSGASTTVFNWTFGGPEEASIPAVATSLTTGEALAAEAERGQEVVVSVEVEGTTGGRTRNVIAELHGESDDRVVMAGGHLDSVDEGPGLNDNASGSAALLEIGLQLARLEPRTSVRFAFWGAEELGLVGSRYYVARLARDEGERILVYLNFDMIGSRNFVRFVYTGPGAVTARAERGARVIERVFLDYFDAVGLAGERLRFGSGSDHTSFARLGVPTGGLFTGASKTKTTRQARVYGGEAGKPYDACYHEACDGYGNVDLRVLHEMADAAAHAVGTFAARPSLLEAR